MYRLCVGYVSEGMGSEGVNKEDNIDNYFLSRIRSNELLPWHQHCATARGKKYKITIEILWQAHVSLEQGSDVLARKLVKIVMYQPQKRPFSAGMY